MRMVFVAAIVAVVAVDLFETAAELALILAG